MALHILQAWHRAPNQSQSFKKTAVLLTLSALLLGFEIIIIK